MEVGRVVKVEVMKTIRIPALTSLIHDGTDEATSQSAATAQWEESRRRCRMAMAKSTKSRAAEGGEEWTHHLD